MTTTWRCSSGSVASASRRSSDAVARRLVVVAVALQLADLLAGDRAALAHVVDGDVAGDADDPRGERHLARLVLRELGHQLREHVLRDVLGLEVVAHDAQHVAVDVVGVADVEEAERFAVALLGARDRLVHGAV